MTTCEVEIFGKKVGTLLERNSQIYFQFDKNCDCNISPYIFERIDATAHNFAELNFNFRLAGVFADSLPDKYGMKFMDEYFMKKRIAPNAIDRLLFIGENGLGALRYKPNIYTEIESQEYNKIKDIQELYIASKKVIEGKSDISLFHRNLLLASGSAGGARAKAVIKFNPKTNECQLYDTHFRHEELEKDFIHAIVKFDELDKNKDLKATDDVKIEYVYSLLAQQCQIDMPNTYLSKDIGDGKQHFVIERFDNKDGKPLHMHSLAGLYNHDFEEMMDYTYLFRMAIYLQTKREDLTEIYKRMVFNFVFRNQDDHTKNFSFLMDQKDNWHFSPAYDLMYNNGKKYTFEHKMSFNGKYGKDVTFKEFEEIAKLFNIKEYKDIIETTQNVCQKNLKDLLIDNRVADNAIDEITSSTRKITKNNAFEDLKKALDEMNNNSVSSPNEDEVKVDDNNQSNKDNKKSPRKRQRR